MQRLAGDGVPRGETVFYSNRRISTGRIRAAERAGTIVAADADGQRRGRNPDRVKPVRMKWHVGNRIHFRIQRNQPPAVGDPGEAVSGSKSATVPQC